MRVIATIAGVVMFVVAFCFAFPVPEAQATDWNAISAVATSAAAIGTFLAVLVALWPIVAGERRRRTVARNLRGRLLAEAVLIRPIIMGPASSGYVLDEDARATLDALDEMYRQADVLTPVEQDLLLSLVANLKFYRRGVRISEDTMMRLNAVLNKLISEWERQGFRQSEGILPLPWSQR